MSVQEIASDFTRYSTMMPQFVIQDTFILALKKELKLIQRYFGKDIVDIKILIDQYDFTFILHWEKFRNPVYLLEKTLYKRGHPPTGIDETIAWIANLFIAKEVLASLINQVIWRIRAIKFALDRFVEGYGRDLYMMMNEFIGYCDNIVTVADEYSKYLIQIDSKITGSRGVTQLSFPKREEIQMGIDECLVKTKYGKKVIFPSVRTFTEFPILEDTKIQIIQMVNRRRKKNRIKDIVFERKFYTDDMFDLIKKICNGNLNEIDILRRIYDWGSGSVHIGQLVPLSLIWYSLIWLKMSMHSITSQKSLRYREMKTVYDELKNCNKITEYSGNVHYVDSIYDRIILP